MKLHVSIALVVFEKKKLSFMTYIQIDKHTETLHGPFFIKRVINEIPGKYKFVFYLLMCVYSFHSILSTTQDKRHETSRKKRA